MGDWTPAYDDTPSLRQLQTDLTTILTGKRRFSVDTHEATFRRDDSVESKPLPGFFDEFFSSFFKVNNPFFMVSATLLNNYNFFSELASYLGKQVGQFWGIIRKPLEILIRSTYI